MLSRIAESLHWMSRYLERADNTARMLQINLLFLLEAEDSLPSDAQWRPLLNITGSEELYFEIYPDGEVTAQRVIEFLTRDRANTGSIRNSLRVARENARALRDRISKEMWEAINELWLTASDRLKMPLIPERATPFYALIRDEVARFHGITMSTMMRGEAFSFYTLGTFLERADMTARIVDVKYHLLLPDLSMVGSPLDYYQWAALLKSLSGFEAYRRRYQAGPRPLDVAAFIIFDPDFPRSLRFGVDRMEQALRKINPDAEQGLSWDALREIHQLLDKTTPKEVFQRGLHEFLELFLERVSAFHSALAVDYFEAHAEETLCVI